MRQFPVIVGLVVGIVLLISFVIFSGSFGKASRDLTDSEICKRSAQLSSNVVAGILAGTELKCPTLFIEVQSTNENAVFQTLALSMADTWNEFLEGKQEIFDTKEGAYCVIRRVVEFKEAQKYSGFFDYLLQKPVLGMNKPYFTYLTNVAVENGKPLESENQQLGELNVIDTSTPYAVIFVMSKDTKFLYNVVGGGTLGYVLTSGNTVDWKSSIVVIPYTQENLNKITCNKLPSSFVSTVKAEG